MSARLDPEPVTRVSNGRLALFVILGSESVFFATLLVAYVALRSQSVWPVEHTLRRLAFPAANTCLLLLSMLPAARSITSIRLGSGEALSRWLAITLLMGLLFVAGQFYEFSRSGLQVSGQVIGAVFFALMTFHALHVLAGIFLLLFNLARSRLGDFSSTRYEAVIISAWFWYYVCAVWVVLFGALYLL